MGSSKHVVGYGAAALVGVGAGAVLGFMGLVTGLCNNAMAGPDGCTPEDELQMTRLFTAAVVAPFVTVAAYALVIAAVRRWTTRRR